MEYFIAGILFITVISPILDSLTALVISFLEVLKGKLAVKVSEYNYQISNIGEEPTMNKIGFSAPIEEDDKENG